MHESTTRDFQERLVTELNAGLGCLTLELGHRLGMFEALAGEGPASPVDLAARLGYQERFVREWLEYMAAGEYLKYAPASGRFSLPSEHAAVLTDPNHPNTGLGLLGWVSVFSAALPKLVKGFRNGEGVPYEAFGADCVAAQGLENRALFLNHYASRWVPAIPGLERTLQNGGRVADVGCGAGWSAIALAKGFPEIEIDALDPDGRSIAEARRIAAVEGLDGRIRFHQSTIEHAPLAGPYALVAAFECLHDMPYPAQALSRMRALAAADGIVLEVDMAVGESLAENTNQFGHICYNFSVLHYLPQVMGFPGTAGTGTVMKPSTLREYAKKAGFDGVDILPMDIAKWHFYLLKL